MLRKIKRSITIEYNAFASISLVTFPIRLGTFSNAWNLLYFELRRTCWEYFGSFANIYRMQRCKFTRVYLKKNLRIYIIRKFDSPCIIINLQIIRKCERNQFYFRSAEFAKQFTANNSFVVWPGFLCWCCSFFGYLSPIKLDKAKNKNVCINLSLFYAKICIIFAIVLQL